MNDCLHCSEQHAAMPLEDFVIAGSKASHGTLTRAAFKEDSGKECVEIELELVLCSGQIYPADG